MELADKLEEFSRSRYEAEIYSAAKEEKALVIDFSLMDRYDPITADMLLESPDLVMDAFREAVERIAGSRVTVRVRGLPESRTIRIRDLRAKHLGKLWTLDTTIRSASEVRPQIYETTFKCPECDADIVVEQDSNLIKKPMQCQCGRRGDFKLASKKLMDIRWLTGTDPFEVVEGEKPGDAAVFLREDLTSPHMQRKSDPGARLRIVGVLRELPKRIRGKMSTKMDMYLEAIHLEPSEADFEEIETTHEDEKLIQELSANEKVYETLRASIAPGIYGYDEIKETLLLQLFGGVVHKLPDGTRIRGNIHVLLTGDPGCLIGDERIVLGNGTIVKIEDIGKRHLQKINASVLTGEGGKKKDKATVFHFYKNQPILEVVTESGKSIKGTYNHPLLCIRNIGGGLVREWKRLDEMKIGDKLAVVTSIPCTVVKHIETGFKPSLRKYGPKFKGKLPKYLDENLAAFMGYVLGDGWVRKYEVGFVVAESEIDILEKLIKLSETLFSKRLYIQKRKIKSSFIGKRAINRKESITYATISSGDISDNLRFLRTKRVPDIILRSGNSVVASFLKWLYEADGSVFDKGRGNRSINLKSKNIELLRDVQMLLLRFTIHSWILGGDNLMIRRGESILKFAKHIGFVSKKKRTKIAQLAKSAEKFKRFTSQRSEKIIKIVRHGREDVYDIEVPKGHRFIANGIISHNTGKTAMMKLVTGIAPRARYVSGTGATGTGMTASVIKNEVIGSWVLEAGALILANKSVLGIDEFDKIGRDDQVALHEAMSVETVSIAKASIVATLPAQTAVLAGANPKLGRFDPYRPIAEQINIPETLLSRFDLKFALRDVPEKGKDEKLAEHIIESRKRPEFVTPPITTNLLRKYIAYAKKTVQKLELTEEAAKMLKDFYIDMRTRSATEETSAVAITLRQYEALHRLAEASAKIRLDTKIRKEDAERAIRLMQYSMSQLGYDFETERFDVDRLEGGVTASRRQRINKILDILESMQKETKEVAIEDVRAEAENQGVTDIDEIIEHLKREGTIFEPRPGFLRKIG